MTFLNTPDQDLLLKWLESMEIPHYLCGNCSGIHLADLQGLSGVVESRLFPEKDFLIFSTELEVLPPAIMALHADLARINAMYACLKAFLECGDDGVYRLVLCDTHWTAAGLSREQFRLFMQATMDAKREVITELRQFGFIADTEDEAQRSSTEALH